MTSPAASSNEQVAALIRDRRSIDFFAPEQVPDEVIREAIDVARWAPNHRLTEPWRFYLVGPETRRGVTDLAVEIEVAKKGERSGGARRARLDAVPGFLVLTTRRSADPLLDREDYAACCCAAQNLMLYLWQLGIGTKWTSGGITRDARFYALLNIDAARESIVGFIWYGKPRVVPQQQRKSTAEIVTALP